MAVISGYKTSATCRLEPVGGSRGGVPATLIDVLTDGARVLADVSLAVGTNVALSIDGVGASTVKALVVGNEGNSGSGFRMQLRLVQGSWPYQAFRMLTTLLLSNKGGPAVPTPPCLIELGLTYPATVKQVETSFLRRVRTAHPDRGGGIEEFVRLRAAYLDALELLGAKR